MHRECWRLTEREEKKSSLWTFQISREQGDSQLGQRLIIHYICHLIAFDDPLILHWFSVPSFGNLASLSIFYCSVSLKLFFPIFRATPIVWLLCKSSLLRQEEGMAGLSGSIRHHGQYSVLQTGGSCQGNESRSYQCCCILCWYGEDNICLTFIDVGTSSGALAAFSGQVVGASPWHHIGFFGHVQVYLWQAALDISV